MDCDQKKNVSDRFLELTGIFDLVTDIKQTFYKCVVVPSRKWPPPPSFDESQPLLWSHVIMFGAILV